jgi:hypothetical protein
MVSCVTVMETPTGRHGVLAAPKVDALPVAAVIAEIEAAEFHSLPALGAQFGLGDQARKYLVREGLIQPEPLKSRHEGYRVNRDEAFTLLLAAALAIAAGVAIAVMLRGVKGAGLTGAAAEGVLRSMT